MKYLYSEYVIAYMSGICRNVRVSIVGLQIIDSDMIPSVAVRLVCVCVKRVVLKTTTNDCLGAVGYSTRYFIR